MKRILCAILAVLLLLSVFAGCDGDKPGTVTSETDVVSDTSTTTTTTTTTVDKNSEAFKNVDRPSTCGRLQVIDGKLCSESGEKVMLRGVSSYGLITGETYINEPCFSELSYNYGMNLYRLAMYTYGVGTIGYCTNGDPERHKQDIANGVEYAKNQDMYVLIDWHILSDGNPNTYVDKSKLFFAEMAEKYKDYNNVLYEICNEPNGDGVTWEEIKKYANEVIPVIREKDPDSVIIVGTPEWSRLVDQALADPLEYDNIMYTFHFYSASHGEDMRQMVESVSQSGLPIFVTEFGVTAASGGFPRDLESADIWVDMLERENISYCMWSFSSVGEACSALNRNVLKENGFEREDFTESGQWIIDTIAKYCSE